MNFLQRFWTLFTQPKQFYSKLRRVGYPPIITFIFSVLFVPYAFFYFIEFDLPIFALLPLVLFIAGFTCLVSPFVSAAVTHLGVLIVGGRGYRKTFGATAHALTIMAPYLLIGALLNLFIGMAGFHEVISGVAGGVVSLAGFIHLVVVEVIGLKVLQKLSTLKALFAALVVPLLISFVAFMIFAVVAGLLLFAALL